MTTSAAPGAADAIAAALGGRTLVKGHGTANDFLLVEDADAHLDLTPGLVAALWLNEQRLSLIHI